MTSYSPQASTRSIDPRSIFMGVIYTLLVFGYVYRALYIVEYEPMRHIWSDPQRHWEQGVDVLRDDPMSLTDPVGFQLYVGAFAKLTFGDKYLSAFYTILLAFTMPWLWYRFFRELQPSKEVALAGWVLIAWLPSWLSIYAYLMQETLMLPLLGASLWATWRCRRKATVNAFLLMVFIWVAAGLTRGVCIPMAAVAATWLWLSQDQKITKAIYSILLFAITLGPLTYRSYDKMNIISPHGIGQMNMLYAKSGNKELQIKYSRKGAVWYYGYGSPAVGSKPLEPFSDWQTKRSGKVFVEINVDNGSEEWQRESDKIPMSFRKYAWLASENLLLLMFDPSWPDSNKGYTLGLINHHLRLIWLPLMLTSIIWFVVLWRKAPERFTRRDLLLPGIFLAWFMIQGFMLLAVNEGRYRKPLEGLVLAQLIFLAGNTRKITALLDPQIALTGSPDEKLQAEEISVTAEQSAFVEEDNEFERSGEHSTLKR
ncbi:Dolichyl-phosphate-mannose-protein mannosyltransferase [Alteromonadaceae bacterium Bs31]|nr:Dolichyl-phosphate-mannose-protein mannosyltransferase [Alteromonadaceae bacterium Bs31]